MYKELDELVLKAKAGDINSKEEILNRLQGLIFNSIQRYYNNKNEYEDLIQEGNKVILESIDSYDSDRGVYFLGYIKTMLKYTYLNMHNKKQTLSLNVPVGDDGENELMDLLESDVDGPLDMFLKLENHMEVRYALSILTDRQREVIVLFYCERLPIGDIAKRLGITYRTVVNTKTRAVERISEVLGE